MAGEQWLSAAVIPLVLALVVVQGGCHWGSCDIAHVLCLILSVICGELC